MTQHTGGCVCGDVRVTASGEPYRVGLRLLMQANPRPPRLTAKHEETRAWLRFCA